MKPLREFLSKMTKGQKIRLAVAGVGLVVLVALAVVLMSRPEYTVLYSGMDTSEAAQIYSFLEGEGEKVKLEGGNSIHVLTKDVNRLRLKLAENNLPSAGSMAYDMYQNNMGMNSTDADKKIMYDFQLAENLSRTIESNAKVEKARVFIHRAQGSSMIKSEAKKETASVHVDLTGQEMLSDTEVGGVVNLVAGGSGIEEANISVIDNLGNSYNSESDSGVGKSSTQLQMEQEIRKGYEQIIYKMLDPVYGEGNSTAMIDFDVNWDERMIESTEYSQPDGSAEEAGLGVSVRNIYEQSGASVGAEGEPGIDTNGGSVPEYPETLGDSSSAYIMREEQINYEINQINEKIIDAQGKVSNLHVSVHINGNLDMEDYTQQFREQIANGLKTDIENVLVETIPYVDTSEADAAAKAEYDAQIKAVQTQKLIRTILIVVGILAAVFLIAKLIRDVSNNNLEAKRAQAAAVSKYTAAAMGGEGGEEGASSIDEDKKHPKRMEIEDFIDRSPEAVAQLLRNWISDDMR